jgi:hypothetical protein
VTEIQRTEESAAAVLREVAADLRDHPDLAEASAVFTDEVLLEVLGIAWRYQYDPDRRVEPQGAVSECVTDVVDEALLDNR